MAETTDMAAIRDRLANERTLLAWIRTALTLMGFGLLVARFAWLVELTGAVESAADEARTTGAVLVVLGSLTSTLGAIRTRAYARLIDPANRPPKSAVLYVSAAVVSVLGAVLAVRISFY